MKRRSPAESCTWSQGINDDFLFTKEQIIIAKQVPRNEVLKENKPATRDTSDWIPTVTYNPALPNIHDILRKKQPILQSTERLRNIFKEVPVVAFCRSPTLGTRGFFSRGSGSFVSSAETGNRAWKASGTSGTVHQTFVTYWFVRNFANDVNTTKPPAGTFRCNSS